MSDTAKRLVSQLIDELDDAAKVLKRHDECATQQMKLLNRQHDATLNSLRACVDSLEEELHQSYDSLYKAFPLYRVDAEVSDRCLRFEDVLTLTVRTLEHRQVMTQDLFATIGRPQANHIASATANEWHPAIHREVMRALGYAS